MAAGRPCRVWQYKSSSSQDWHDYPPAACAVVDSAQFAGLAEASFNTEGRFYTVCLASMQQWPTGQPRKARQVRVLDFVGWQHNARPGHNRWANFPDEVSCEVETAFWAGHPTVRVTIGDQLYEIDFEAMEQFCCSDPTRTRRVRRGGAVPEVDQPHHLQVWASSSNFLDGVPSYWAAFTTDTMLVTCRPDVVANVQRLLDQTLNRVWTRDRTSRAGQPNGVVPAGYHVTLVQRVQSKGQWQAFCAERRAVAEVCSVDRGFRPRKVKTDGLAPEPARLDGGCDEVYLFHGSPQCEAIVREGFDRSKAKVTGLLGPMFYFAEDSTKADEYAGAGHQLSMLLCRVVLGLRRFTDEPSPDKAALAAELQSRCHSVHAFRRQTTGINEFAVPEARRIYAEYLITYTRI